MAMHEVETRGGLVSIMRIVLCKEKSEALSLSLKWIFKA